MFYIEAVERDSSSSLDFDGSHDELAVRRILAL